MNNELITYFHESWIYEISPNKRAMSEKQKSRYMNNELITYFHESWIYEKVLRIFLKAAKFL